jgi:hypothetical protein
MRLLFNFFGSLSGLILFFAIVATCIKLKLNIFLVFGFIIVVFNIISFLGIKKDRASKLK